MHLELQLDQLLQQDQQDQLIRSLLSLQEHHQVLPAQYCRDFQQLLMHRLTPMDPCFQLTQDCPPDRKNLLPLFFRCLLWLRPAPHFPVALMPQ